MNMCLYGQYAFICLGYYVVFVDLYWEPPHCSPLWLELFESIRAVQMSRCFMLSLVLFCQTFYTNHSNSCVICLFAFCCCCFVMVVWFCVGLVQGLSHTREEIHKWAVMTAGWDFSHMLLAAPVPSLMKLVQVFCLLKKKIRLLILTCKHFVYSGYNSFVKHILEKNIFSIIGLHFS